MNFQRTLALVPAAVLVACTYTVLPEQKNKLIRVHSADVVKGCELKGTYHVTLDSANEVVVKDRNDNFAYRKVISEGANVVLQPKAEVGQPAIVSMYRCPCVTPQQSAGDGGRK